MNPRKLERKFMCIVSFISHCKLVGWKLLCFISYILGEWSMRSWISSPKTLLVSRGRRPSGPRHLVTEPWLAITRHCYINSGPWQMSHSRAGEITVVKRLASVPEDLNSMLSTQVSPITTVCNSSPRWPDTLSWPVKVSLCLNILTPPNTHIHK